MNLHTISKRITAVALSAVLLFTASGCTNSSVAAAPDAEFDAFLEELFTEEVTSNTRRGTALRIWSQRSAIWMTATLQTWIPTGTIWMAPFRN